MSGYMSDNAEALVGIFDAVREEHLIDVMQAGLLACTCGERLPIFYGDDGQPLYNPAIRHHHEQQAAALLASDWMRQHDDAVRAEALEEAADARDEWQAALNREDERHFVAGSAHGAGPDAACDVFEGFLRDRAARLRAGGDS